MAELMCRIPVSARYELDHTTGIMTKVSAEYADIPADLIARFLIEKFGIDAIFGEGETA